MALCGPTARFSWPHHSQEDTEQVEADCTYENREQAYREAFGLTATELSRYVMRKAEMPKLILEGMNAFASTPPAISSLSA